MAWNFIATQSLFGGPTRNNRKKKQPHGPNKTKDVENADLFFLPKKEDHNRKKNMRKLFLKKCYR